SLIKFFQMVLLDADQLRFKNFPTSLDMARKLLGINMHTKEYGVCPSCDILYEVSEVINKQDKDFECTHVEFPSHPMHSQKKLCGVELTKQ
ncbi:5567_t:CDS:1, partial [Racocetra fulgida]